MNHFPDDDALNLAKTLIKQFEGCELKSYWDLAGVLTIGWGDTQDVHPGQVITQEEADQRLEDRVLMFAQAVDGLVSVQLLANEAAALIDFTYNLGSHALAGSTLLKDVNAGNFADVPAQLERWDRANGEQVPGLTRRRQAEADLWSAGSSA